MKMINEEGWTKLAYCGPALRDGPVLIMRDGWDEPVIGTADAMNPQANSPKAISSSFV